MNITVMHYTQPEPPKAKVKIEKIKGSGDKACAAVAFMHVMDTDYDTARSIMIEAVEFDHNKGIRDLTLRKFMKEWGWTWHPLGKNLKTYDLSLLPERCILDFSVHVAACINGVVLDQFLTYTAVGCKRIIGYYAPTGA